MLRKGGSVGTGAYRKEAEMESRAVLLAEPKKNWTLLQLGPLYRGGGGDPSFRTSFRTWSPPALTDCRGGRGAKWRALMWQQWKKFCFGSLGARGLLGAFRTHRLLRSVPLASNCWPETAWRGGGGSRPRHPLPGQFTSNCRLQPSVDRKPSVKRQQPCQPPSANCPPLPNTRNSAP